MTAFRRGQAVVLVGIFLMAAGYALATQLSVVVFGLKKLEILPYATLFSGLAAMIVPIIKRWYSWEEIKENYKDFATAGLCAVGIVVLGLASYANPDLNAAVATVLLKSPLIPLAYIIDYYLGEKLNYKDISAFFLALGAVGVAAFGAYIDPQTNQQHTWEVLKSPGFLVPLVLYFALYGKRMPIIRKYAKNPRYAGNEQPFTILFSWALFMVAIPLIAHFSPESSAGNVCTQMWSSLMHPTKKKLLIGFCGGGMFGLYASAVVWVINSARNTSQAALIHKALSGFGNSFSAEIVTAVKLRSLFHILPLTQFVHKTIHDPGSPGLFDWISVAVFFIATGVAALGALERSRDKQRSIVSQRLQSSVIPVTS
jgi:hypothetical protein